MWVWLFDGNLDIDLSYLQIILQFYAILQIIQVKTEGGGGKVDVTVQLHSNTTTTTWDKHDNRRSKNYRQPVERECTQCKYKKYKVISPIKSLFFCK